MPIFPCCGVMVMRSVSRPTISALIPRVRRLRSIEAMMMKMSASGALVLNSLAPLST